MKNNKKTKVGFLLPGLGFIKRGAEQAFIEIGKNLALCDDLEVIFFGGGEFKVEGIKFVKVPLIKRQRFERFPRIWFFSAYDYEELTYSWFLLPTLLRNPCDIYIVCSFRFVFLVLWALKFIFRKKFKLYYSTQNGIWPANAARFAKLFFCDAMFCTNPVYLDQMKGRCKCLLAPNGFDDKFWL